MSYAQWRWQFPDNPFSRPIVYVAEAPGGRLIGHYSLIPLPFLRDGVRSLAALSIQSMIHPEYQKRGILKGLAAEAEKQLDKDGVTTGITFLNDNSLHAYIRHFGWTELEGRNFIYFTVLDFRGLVQRWVRSGWVAALGAALMNPAIRLVFRRSSGCSRAVTIRAVDRFDARVDALWLSFRRNLRYTVDRTAKYLNWRLVDKPAEYSRFVAEEGSTLVGLAVTKKETKFGLHFGYLVEILTDPLRPEVATELIRHALDHLRSQGCSVATAVTAGSPSILVALRRAGFRRLPRRAMPHGIHFCFKTRDGSDHPPPSGWFLSWADHDVV